MYETSFGFTRSPFLDPEGSEFRPCGAQAAVLAELREALDAGAALVVLSGPIGTGKTTLLRRALGEPMRQRHVVLFWNAHVGPDDLLNYLCDDLDLRSPGTGRTERLKALRTALVRGLSEGWSLLIAVDDAQNLPAETLAELHALLDLREVGHGMVQVLLCGQPELQDRLVHDPQRDAHPPRRLTLRTLDATESAAFIAARLSAAGRPDADLFDAEALVRIHELAHGVPRLLNRICNQSLLLAYLGSERRVTAALVRDVAADTPPTEPPPQPAGPLYETMPARPVIAADSVPHMHAPAHESVPAAGPDPDNAPAAAQAASAHLHADPHAHGHRPSRRRSRWWIGLAAVMSALALAGFAAWRNGWLPGLPPPRPAQPVAASTRPLPAPTPADAVAVRSPGHALTPAAPAGTAPADSAIPTPPAAGHQDAPEGPRGLVAPTQPVTETAPAPVPAPLMPPAPADDAAAAVVTARAAPAQEASPPAAAVVVPPEADAGAGASPGSDTAATPASAPAPAPVEDAVASAVRALLVQARSQYAGMRYTQPPDDNALQTWRQVLKLAPGNAEALAGITGIRARFIGWGRQAQARGELERALRHYEIARGIGEDEELSGLIAETRRRRDGGR